MMGPSFIPTGFRDFVLRISHSRPTSSLRDGYYFHVLIQTSLGEGLGTLLLTIEGVSETTDDEAVTDEKHPHTPSFKLAPHP
jgi:hypothetical protein